MFVSCLCGAGIAYSAWWSCYGLDIRWIFARFSLEAWYCIYFPNSPQTGRKVLTGPPIHWVKQPVLEADHSGGSVKMSQSSVCGGPRWLRCCATNRKVAGSIPASVIGFFVDIKSFRSHYGPGVDSASNRNEYQECSRCVRLTTYHRPVPLSRNLGNLTS